MGNKIKFHYLTLSIFIFAALHLTLLKTEFYGNRGWIDLPLHFIMGTFFGAIFLWWQGRKSKNISQNSLIISLCLAGLAGGLIWELIEFILWNFFPIVGNYIEIKKTPLRDIISDLFLDVFGSLSWFIFAKIKK